MTDETPREDAEEAEGPQGAEAEEDAIAEGNHTETRVVRRFVTRGGQLVEISGGPRLEIRG